MENILLTLVVVLLVLVLFMLAGVVVLGWKIMRKQIPGQFPPPLPTDVPVAAKDPTAHFHPEARERLSEARRLASLNEAICSNHPEQSSEGACAICDRHFCRGCLKNFGNLVFCREHHRVFTSTEWEEIRSLKSDPAHPEAGVALVEWKKRLWESDGMPLYVETHYKIDVHGDHIESWVVLYARKSEKGEVMKRLEDQGPSSSLS